MGCDIHAYLQITPLNTSTSVGLGEANLGRNYELFGLMAGVRCHDYTPEADVRGLPDPIALDIKEEFDSRGEDAHTPSWLTTQELIRVCRKLEKIQGRRHQKLRSLCGFMVDLERRELHPQLVFWFDS